MGRFMLQFSGDLYIFIDDVAMSVPPGRVHLCLDNITRNQVGRHVRNQSKRCFTRWNFNHRPFVPEAIDIRGIITATAVVNS